MYRRVFKAEHGKREFENVGIKPFRTTHGTSATSMGRPAIKVFVHEGSGSGSGHKDQKNESRKMPESNSVPVGTAASPRTGAERHRPSRPDMPIVGTVGFPPQLPLRESHVARA